MKKKWKPEDYVTHTVHPIRIKARCPDDPLAFLSVDGRVGKMLGIFSLDSTLSYRQNPKEESFFINGAGSETGKLSKADISYVVGVYNHKSFHRSDVVFIGAMPPEDVQIHGIIHKYTDAKIVLRFHNDKAHIKCPKIGYVPVWSKEISDNVLRAIKRYNHSISSKPKQIGKKKIYSYPKILELKDNGFILMGKTLDEIQKTYKKFK